VTFDLGHLFLRHFWTRKLPVTQENYWSDFIQLYVVMYLSWLHKSRSEHILWRWEVKKARYYCCGMIRYCQYYETVSHLYYLTVNNLVTKLSMLAYRGLAPRKHPCWRWCQTSCLQPIIRKLLWRRCWSECSVRLCRSHIDLLYRLQPQLSVCGLHASANNKRRRHIGLGSTVRPFVVHTLTPIWRDAISLYLAEGRINETYHEYSSHE